MWRDGIRRHGGTQRERWRQRGGGHAAVFWLLSKGSVASSEQTKYWSQLNITFPFRARALGDVADAREVEERGLCGGDVLSLRNAP